MDELLRKIGEQIVNPIITLMIASAVVFFIYGVVEFVGAADNEEARNKGKQHIVWGVVGIFIMVSVWGIMNILNNFWSASPLPDKKEDRYKAENPAAQIKLNNPNFKDSINDPNFNPDKPFQFK